MKRILSRFTILAALLAAGVAAQDPPTRPKRNPARFLPAYWSRVVTSEQREAIYAINEKYAQQESALKAQLGELRSKRLAEAEALLTVEQKERIAAVASASKARSKAVADAAKPKSAAAKE